MRRLIKRMAFEEKARSLVTLDANTRLVPDRQRIELKPNADTGLFPAAGVFRSWITNPKSCKQWLGFQSFEVIPADELFEPYCSIYYRLSTTGTSDLFWNGIAWATAGANDWNTEAEIAANISTYPIAGRSIQVVANLRTDDPKYTPALSMVKFLYKSDIDCQEDLIYRSLIPSLRESITALADATAKKTSAGVSLPFDPAGIEGPYQFQAVEEVYNHTDDEDHLYNLYSSYNPTTKVITLTSAVPANKTMFIKFRYSPEVMVHTSRDFHEVAAVPALVLQNIDVAGTWDTEAYDHIVLNKETGAAVKVPDAKQFDMDFTMAVLTAKAVDLQRLQEAVRIWIRNNVAFKSRGLDELYHLQLIQPFGGQGVIGQSEVHSGRIRFRILKALFYDRPDEDAWAVVRFTLRGPPNNVIEES